MIRRNQDFLNKVNIVLDMLLVVLAYVLSAWLWLDILDGQEDNMAALSGKSILMSIVYAVALFFLLSMFGFYSTTRTRRLVWKLKTILMATTLAMLLSSSVLFVLKLVDFSRGVLLLFYVFTLLLIMGKYTAMRLAFNELRSHGFNLKHVVIVGTGGLAKQFARDAEADPGLGMHILGFVGAQTEDRYLGGYDALDGILEPTDVSEAVIALDPEEYARIQGIIAICEKNGVPYSVIPFYNDMIPAHPVIETVGKSKLITMRANRLENVGWAALKRGFDILCSLLGLVVLSPLMLALTVGVKLSSPGPVLFRQTRVGYKRKHFQMLKFRSMKVNAEENTGWTKEQDNRRTRFGSLMRKTSLDELPQLLNVLKGDMSLVGPRPELPYFVEQFRESVPLYMVKHQVKPGMTGWAQVNGYRGDTSIRKRIELDLWYIDNWSVWLDLKILFRTVFGGMLNREDLRRGSDE